MNLKYPADQCLELWDHPESISDLSRIFSDYLRGSLSCLPWCDSPLQSETSILSERLLSMNQNGFLTINSQPAVDGALSSDKVYGWGPKNGFVYQKAYLEFFISAAGMEKLLARIGAYPYMTFYGINNEVFYCN